MADAAVATPILAVGHGRKRKAAKSEVHRSEPRSVAEKSPPAKRALITGTTKSPGDDGVASVKTSSGANRNPVLIQTTGSPSIGNVAELENLVFEDLSRISEHFEGMPIEAIRSATRSRLVEVVEIMRMTRRAKEAQLVLNEYVSSVKDMARHCLIGHSLYSQPLGRCRVLSGHEAGIVADAIKKFASQLSVRLFRDGREPDFPFNPKRAINLSDEERAMSRDSFKHRMLFGNSERSLTLAYGTDSMFTITCRDLRGEELADFTRLCGGRLPSVLSSFISIYLHPKISESSALSGPEHSDRALMSPQRELLVYYCTPYEQWPRGLSPAVKNAMEIEIGRHLGTALYSPTGKDLRVSTKDVFSVLLDLVQLLILDRNPNVGTMVFNKLRSVYDPETLFSLKSLPSDASDLLSNNDKTTVVKFKDVEPKSRETEEGDTKNKSPRAVIGSFISQSAQDYSSQQRYLYETGNVATAS